MTKLLAVGDEVTIEVRLGNLIIRTVSRVTAKYAWLGTVNGGIKVHRNVDRDGYIKPVGEDVWSTITYRLTTDIDRVNIHKAKLVAALTNTDWQAFTLAQLQQICTQIDAIKLITQMKGKSND